MATPDIGPGHDDLGTQRAQMVDLLLAHLVRDDQQQLVALLRRDQRQAEAGIAGGRLDQRGLARRDLARAFRRLDHRQADAVLDRPAGILALQLQEQPARACIQAGDFQHRRVADQREDRLRGGHIIILNLFVNYKNHSHMTVNCIWPYPVKEKRNPGPKTAHRKSRVRHRTGAGKEQGRREGVTTGPVPGRSFPSIAERPARCGRVGAAGRARIRHGYGRDCRASPRCGRSRPPPPRHRG